MASVFRYLSTSILCLLLCCFYCTVLRHSFILLCWIQTVRTQFLPRSRCRHHHQFCGVSVLLILRLLSLLAPIKFPTQKPGEPYSSPAHYVLPLLSTGPQECWQQYWGKDTSPAETQRFGPHMCHFTSWYIYSRPCYENVTNNRSDYVWQLIKSFSLMPALVPLWDSTTLNYPECVLAI